MASGRRARRLAEKSRSTSRRHSAISSAAAVSIRRLIHRIVHRAAKVPHDADRPPLFGWKHEERVREGGVAGHDRTCSLFAIRYSQFVRRLRLSTPPCATLSLTRRRLRAWALLMARRSRSVRADRAPACRQARWRAARSEDGRKHRHRPVVLASKSCRVRGTDVAERRPPRRRSAGRFDSVDGSAPCRRHTSSGTYRRPRDQSMAQILPEVGQLKRRAERVRGRIEIVPPIAEDAKDQAADGIRRSAAVVEHLGPRRVASRRHILPKRAQEIGEQSDRQIEALDRVVKGEEHGVGIGCRQSAAGRRRWHPPNSARERVESSPIRQATAVETLGGTQSRFVGEIVGDSRKGVDGGDVRAQRAPAATTRRPGKFS